MFSGPFQLSDPLAIAALTGAALLALVALCSLFARKVEKYPYVAAGALLTPAERSFFQALESALEGEGVKLFAKVRLGDIMQVRAGVPPKERHRAYSRISSKHADFVVCDPRTFRVMGVIELDDKSHDAPVRRRRDEFVDGALTAAGIPILRVVARRTYDLEALRSEAKSLFRLGVSGRRKDRALVKKIDI